MAKKEYKEIDVTSLYSELAAAKAVEEGKKDVFVKIAFFVAIAMTLFHIYTALGYKVEQAKEAGIDVE